MSRTQNYLESCCDIVGWFKDNYTFEENTILKINDLYENFKLSETYLEMSKSSKDKYTKLKFYSYIESNIFFRKYYKERYYNYRTIIIGWKINNNNKIIIYFKIEFKI